MSRQKKEYRIVILAPENNEKKIRLKNNIGKAYCDFILDYISKEGISDEQMAEMYKRIIKEMDIKRKSKK